MGLGRSDLLINLNNHEYVVEFKIYRNPAQFERGKKQLAYYAKNLGCPEGIYIVFIPNTVKLDDIKEETITIDNTLIQVFIIYYDEDKDF